MTRPGIIAIVAALGFYAGMSTWFIAANAPTYDEPSYYYSGYARLLSGDVAVNVHQPPLSKALAALPIFALSRLGAMPAPSFTPLDEATDDPVLGFLFDSPASFTTMLVLGRLPMLLCGALTILVIGRWAFHLWGTAGVGLACALAATEPTFVAHTSLMTPDGVVTLCYVTFFYLVWRYGGAPTWGRLLAAGVALGAAIGAKFSALAALPALAAIVIVEAFQGGWAWPHGGRRQSLLTLVVVPCLWLGVAGATLLMLYGWEGLPVLRQGIAGQLAHVAEGHPAYFWGAYSERGWWYYFPAVFLLKTPLPTLLALGASAALPWVGQRFDGRAFVYLAIPSATVLGATTWGGVDIGVRYLLPAYPLLFVAAGRVATMGRFAILCVGAALVANIAGILTVAPHFLASANVVAGGPAGLGRVLGDSNVDWGQDLGTLRRWMADEGVSAVYLSYFGTARVSAYGIRHQSLPSNFSTGNQDVLPPGTRPLVAVSVTNLHGIYLTHRDLYAWLRAREPIAMLGWSIYVYDLSDEPRLHCRLAEIYAAANESAYAAHERRLCAGS